MVRLRLQHRLELGGRVPDPHRLVEGHGQVVPHGDRGGAEGQGLPVLLDGVPVPPQLRVHDAEVRPRLPALRRDLEKTPVLRRRLVELARLLQLDGAGGDRRRVLGPGAARPRAPGAGGGRGGGHLDESQQEERGRHVPILAQYESRRRPPVRNSPALVPALVAALALSILEAPAQEPKPLDAKAFAQRVEVAATPVHPFRYNQPIPTPNQTKPLLTRRRAFFPGEKVTLSFRVPEGASLASPVRARVVLTLHDLLGAKRHDLGETEASASATGVEGTLAWTVPDVAEGQYLLAARFTSTDGQPLASRSNVVLVVPEYPRLLEAAQAALARVKEKAARLRELPLHELPVARSLAEVGPAHLGVLDEHLG
ncbi:MAG: hypothetical protein H6Q88_3641, partial [Anaeromyxobacteraceae bacterium]|nr:hypothetical protein [Anaeromyxobacteraceae bacterium]